jgi:hypothetical protein
MLKTFSGVVLLLLQKLLLLLWFRVLDKVLITASQTATAALVAGQVDGVLQKFFMITLLLVVISK